MTKVKCEHCGGEFGMNDTLKVSGVTLCDQCAEHDPRSPHRSVHQGEHGPDRHHRRACDPGPRGQEERLRKEE